MRQTSFLKPGSAAYGGVLLNTRKGRKHGRPLSTRESMHLVLRSSRAVGAWSFRAPRNDRKVRAFTQKFSKRYGVRVLKLANVGNHLHFHIQLGNRHLYRPFIRALTGAIALSVTEAKKGEPLKRDESGQTKTPRFWDYRPFTRIVRGYRALLTLRDYLEINELEGLGTPRTEARVLIALNRARAWRKRRPPAFR
jgi:putative transposase